jgi:hypothetical protein
MGVFSTSLLYRIFSRTAEIMNQSTVLVGSQAVKMDYVSRAMRRREPCVRKAALVFCPLKNTIKFFVLTLGNSLLIIAKILVKSRACGEKIFSLGVRCKLASPACFSLCYNSLRHQDKKEPTNPFDQKPSLPQKYCPGRHQFSHISCSHPFWGGIPILADWQTTALAG